MKRNLLFVAMSLFAMMALAQTRVKDYVEVMYFHGKQRCVTCMAIEKHAREVVEMDFAHEKKNGQVVFRVVDISTPEGAKIAYSGQSLSTCHQHHSHRLYKQGY